MSFSGIVLTDDGKNELAAAEMGGSFCITDIVFGEGLYSGERSAAKAVVSPVMTLPVSKIERDPQMAGRILIECDFNSVDVPKAFYWREIGIIANKKLCYYDNSADDAEYFDPVAETVIKQKRMRIILQISSDVPVNISISSSLYATDEEMQKILYPEYTETSKLEHMSQKESLFVMLSKLSKGLTELIEHLDNRENPHNLTPANLGLGNVDDTSDANKPVSTAQRKAIDEAYANSNYYVDEKIAALIDGAPSTLDTLKEIADAMKENEDVVKALNEAIGTKASEKEFASHVNNSTNPHGVTKAQVGLGNANNTSDENKPISKKQQEALDLKLAKTGDTKDNTVTFAAGDSINPTGWADIVAVTSGETHASLFRKISLAIKNLRYLYKIMGNTDISVIGDGTATGAISALNSKLMSFGTGTISLFSIQSYVAPADGFVMIYANPTTSATESILVDVTGGFNTSIRCTTFDGISATTMGVVKKGSALRLSATDGLESSSVCVYIPIH